MHIRTILNKTTQFTACTLSLPSPFFRFLQKNGILSGSIFIFMSASLNILAFDLTSGSASPAILLTMLAMYVSILPLYLMVSIIDPLVCFLRDHNVIFRKEFFRSMYALSLAFFVMILMVSLASLICYAAGVSSDNLKALTDSRLSVMIWSVILISMHYSALLAYGFRSHHRIVFLGLFIFMFLLSPLLNVSFK